MFFFVDLLIFHYIFILGIIFWCILSYRFFNSRALLLFFKALAIALFSPPDNVSLNYFKMDFTSAEQFSPTDQREVGEEGGES